MALQANELRIGNYFTSPNGNIQILSSIWQRDEVEWWGSNEAKAHFELSTRNPIPLTPEILEKCGFHSKYKSVHMQWNIGGFYLHQKSDVDDDNISIPEENVFHYDFTYEIKYLHQLQNLYFALTGEELNYTP